MGYSENESMVRVDFFKPSGKWYTTEACDMGPYYDLSPRDALLSVIRGEIAGRLSGMTAVCLEPYTNHSYPIMVQVDDARKG